MTKQSSENQGIHANCHESLTEYYRNHQLTFSLINDVCIGEVFKKTEKRAYCEAVDLESARQYCRQIVDESLSQEVVLNNNLEPNWQSLACALQSIQPELNNAIRYLLREHIKHNNAPIESEALKTVGGFSSTTDVMFAYAEFARLLSDALRYVPPHQHSGQDAYLSMAIITHEPKICSQANKQTDLKQSGLAISLTSPIFKALQQMSDV